MNLAIRPKPTWLPDSIWQRIICRVLAVGMLCALLAGCDSFVRASVDTLAAAKGFIGQAQKNHEAECKADPAKPFPCQMINQAVDAKNYGVSALEVYCQLPVAPDPETLAAMGTKACNANPKAKDVLVSALSNLVNILDSYKAQNGGRP